MATYWPKNRSLINCLITFYLAACCSPCSAENKLALRHRQEVSSSVADKESDLNPAKVGDGLVVRPIVRELRTVRPIRSIGYADHAEQLVVSFHELPSTLLDLQLNRDLIADHFDVRHHVDGSEIWRPDQFAANSLPLCHYRGTLRNASNSWVTLSTCFGLSGAVFDGVHLFYIESLNNSVDGDHSWIQHSQELKPATRCVEDRREPAGWPMNHKSTKVKRQTKSNQLTAASHNVELVLVVDNAIYRRNKGDMYSILKRVFDVVNVIGQIYSPLQISVVLVGVVVWSAGDKINIDKDASHTLSEFKKYRRAHLETKMHDNAHLMTGVEGSYFGGPVGRAYVGTLCNAHDSCGIAVDDAKSPAAMTASIMAHEMGHNFGMHHDDDSCQCRPGDCVMAAAIGKPTMHWSSCSRQLIQTTMREAKHGCLRNRPSRCGNMALDPGEECDCGLPHYCRNQCCDPHTCKFSQRSLKVQCADGGCCDLRTCQWELAGVECRPAENDCDLPEYCLGNGPACPSDLHKYNGLKCQSRRVCIDGKCSVDLSGRHNRFVQCATNCTNGGFCNNLGKCHCPDGFNPPYCQQYGMGGSEDGGPSLDPKVRRLFQIELYVVFLAIVPITGFLFFVFYFFLDDEQKEFFWVSIRRRCGRGGNHKFAGRLYPIQSLIQSTIDEHREKRDFSLWLKDRVKLTLPSIVSLPVNGPSCSTLSPASGCSTATLTLSAVNTPEASLSTANAFLPLPPPMEDKKLLIPPAGRVARPAPPPPPEQAGRVAQEDVAVDRAKSAGNKFPLPIPPSWARPPLL